MSSFGGILGIQTQKVNYKKTEETFNEKYHVAETLG